jgi:hypothetical protein
MKVHLLRTKDVSLDTYNNVLNLVRSFNGPIVFESNEEEQIIDHVTSRHIIEREDFEKQERNLARMSFSEKIYKPYSFPIEEQKAKWEDFFDICRTFRQANKILESEFVFLLTETGNEKNWFGAVDEEMRNVFIQTSHWDHFFGSAVDSRFPICYEIAAWLLRIQMFNNRNEVITGTHEKPIGCMMDFCQDKMEIVLKMRTADICQSCLQVLHNRDISRPLTQQLFDMMDGIRKHFMFRERSEFLNRPSRMEIKGYNHRIFLTDLGNLEVLLNPKERTLFIFFLRHPEGVPLSHLFEYIFEIQYLYEKFSMRSSKDIINQAVMRMVDPLDENQIQVISRIRRKFKVLLGTNMASFYAINVVDNKYQISLNRELITWNIEL